MRDNIICIGTTAIYNLVFNAQYIWESIHRSLRSLSVSLLLAHKDPDESSSEILVEQSIYDLKEKNTTEGNDKPESNWTHHIKKLMY